VDWHQAHRQALMSVRDWPHWENRAIKRRLPDEGIELVMAHLVSRGSGEWADETRARCRIFYRTPAEWAAVISGWVRAQGVAGSGGTLFTVYELYAGGAAYGTGAR
jgi:ESCRT-II complex subunit VPS25